MPNQSENKAPLNHLIEWLNEHGNGERHAVARLGSEPDRIDGVMPHIVVTPFTIEQLSAVVRFANEHNLRLTPRGGATQMTWGGILETVDILVDMSFMNDIVDYEPADMTITVEAGCTLEQLQSILEKNHQYLPIDPPVHASATLGGILATNAAGPLRFAFGTMRDYLLGARVVRANGEITQAGGNVVKNAAGYELSKLYTGSLGTLGLFAELTFMVRPLSETKEAVFIPLPRVEIAEPVLSTVLDAALEPSLVELMNEAAMNLLPPDALPSPQPLPPYGLLIGFTGSTVAVAWQVQHIVQLITDLPTPTGHELKPVSIPWDPIYNGLLKARRASPTALVCRANLLSSEVVSFFDRAEALFQSHQLRAPLMAHAGSGVVHIHIDPIPEQPSRLVKSLLRAASTVPTAPAVPPIDPGRERKSATQAAMDPARSDLPGLGDLEGLRRLSIGNLVVECAPAEVRKTLPIWGRERTSHILMKEVKKRFDPENTLNMGRTVGG